MNYLPPKIISYLKDEKYNFDLADIKIQRDRIMLPLRKDGVFILYALKSDSEALKADLEKEIKILTEFKRTPLASNVPNLVNYSLQDHWLIRESVEGSVGGNVYDLDSAFLDHKYIPELIHILNCIRKASVDLPVFGKKEMKEVIDDIKRNKYIDDLLIDKYSELLDKQEIDCSGFIHRDLQPTNLIFGSNVYLIDFEKSAIGNYYFDFVSLYHRGEKSVEWQKQLLDSFTVSLERDNLIFSPLLFQVFYAYFLILDIVSLDLVFVKKRMKAFHQTDISKEEAMQKRDAYIEKLKPLI